MRNDLKNLIVSNPEESDRSLAHENVHFTKMNGNCVTESSKLADESVKC